MHPRVGTVYDVNKTTLVNLDVVGLDGEVADLHGRLARGDCNIRAPDVGVGGRRGNVVRYFPGAKRISYVDRPHPCVEPRYEDQLPVEEIGEIFAAGVGTEAAAAVAEVTAVLTDLVIGDDRRFGFVPGGPGRDVYKINELAVPGAYARATAAAGFVDQDNKVPRRVLRLRGQRWHRLSKQREGGMCAKGRRGVQAAKLWAEKVRLRGVGPEICRRWTSVSGWVQQLLPINDLENAIRPGPMTEVDAFGHSLDALGPDGDWSVEVLRNRSRSPWLLPMQAPELVELIGSKRGAGPSQKGTISLVESGSSRAYEAGFTAVPA